jgi:hypothetical protein
MRDTLSEIISDTVSSVQITDNTVILQKRKRKTHDKDVDKIRRNQAIADQVMTYNDGQVEDMTRAFNWKAHPPTAPLGPNVLPASYYSRLKLPKAKDVLRDALLMLPG